jgi:hypothetical protein
MQKSPRLARAGSFSLSSVAVDCLGVHQCQCPVEPILAHLVFDRVRQYPKPFGDGHYRVSVRRTGQTAFLDRTFGFFAELKPFGYLLG